MHIKKATFLKKGTRIIHHIFSISKKITFETKIYFNISTSSKLLKLKIFRLKKELNQR